MSEFRFTVGSAILRGPDGVLLVCNRRRGGHVDWSPPGGVVDAGESVCDAIAREVAEETGLVVEEFGPRLYEVEATAVDMGWTLRVEVWEAGRFSGSLAAGADPDGIVIDAHYCAVDLAADRLASSPLWVREPLLTHLRSGSAPVVDDVFRYRVEGTRPAEMRAVRL